MMKNNAITKKTLVGVNLRNQTGSLTLIGLMVGAVIICFVFLMTYFKRPPIDSETETYFSQEDIDTSTYKSILEGTKARIGDVEKQMLEREDGLLKSMQGVE